MTSGKPEVTALLHEPSSNITYLVVDTETGKAAVIDPAADFNLATGCLGNAPNDRLVDIVTARGLSVDWIIETHVHADHLSGAQDLKQRLGGKVAIGRRITEVQEVFAEVFGEGADFARDGSQFDHLFAPDEAFKIGEIEAHAIATPGHTPACMSYHIGDAVFVGDSIFMPDFGTARCDFPGGSASELYRSAQRILALPEETRLFVGHDYGAGGREIAWESTVGDEAQMNKHVGRGIKASEFIEMRETRDAQLGLPGMIIPAIQVNMRAGKLPDPDGNGIAYLKMPVNGFPGAT